MKNAAKALRKSMATSVRRLRGGSDLGRWGTREALFEGWDERTRRIANLIPPNMRVIEFGAGRMVLKNLLSQTCEYTPSDLVDRGPGTVVCDLNGELLPDFGTHNVAVFSGVLEYVNDVPRLVFHLASRVDRIVASYAVADTFSRGRRAQGWVNDFTSEQFVHIFESAGFDCDYRERWNNQIIYRFRRLRN